MSVARALRHTVVSRLTRTLGLAVTHMRDLDAFKPSRQVVADFYKIEVADMYSKKASTGFDDMDDDIPF